MWFVCVCLDMGICAFTVAPRHRNDRAAPALKCVCVDCLRFCLIACIGVCVVVVVVVVVVCVHVVGGSVFAIAGATVVLWRYHLLVFLLLFFVVVVLFIGIVVGVLCLLVLLFLFLSLSFVVIVC